MLDFISIGIGVVGSLLVAKAAQISSKGEDQLTQSSKILAQANEALAKAQANLLEANGEKLEANSITADGVNLQLRGMIHPAIVLIQAMEEIHDDTKSNILLEKVLQAMPAEFQKSGLQKEDIRTFLCLVHEFIHSTPDNFAIQKRLDQLGSQGKLALSAAGAKAMQAVHSKLDADDEQDLKEYYPSFKAAIQAALTANEL